MIKSPRLLIACFAVALLTGGGAIRFFKSDSDGFFGPPDDDGDISPEAIRILDAPDSFVLYSLHPVPMDFRRSVAPPPPGSTNVVQFGEGFHGFEILGKTEISDSIWREELVEAFKKGIHEGKGQPPACFDPRHGIRVVKKGTTVDFVICFECITVMEVVSSTRYLRISYSPRDVFNNALKKANLPLAAEE